MIGFGRSWRGAPCCYTISGVDAPACREKTVNSRRTRRRPLVCSTGTHELPTLIASVAHIFQDCSDDIGEFFIANGATVHYYFAHHDENKSVWDAVPFHHQVPYWSHYDAVFANSGNHPYMSEESVLISAFELQQAAVPFFWLSQYDGAGDINEWEASKVSRFHESGARYVDVRSMTHGLRSLTRGAVESGEKTKESNAEDDRFVEHAGGDPHFCLPGPPDEMALLLLKLMWAVHEYS